VNVDGKTLLIYRYEGEKEKAHELRFDASYSNIVSYHCKKNGEIIVAFRDGTVVVCGREKGRPDSEKLNIRFYKEALCDMVYCESSHYVATCSYNQVKVANISFASSLNMPLVDEPVVESERVTLTANGSLLTVSSTAGCLYTYKVALSDSNYNKDSFLSQIEFLKTTVSPGSLVTSFSLLLFMSVVGISNYILDVSVMDFLYVLSFPTAACV
jgi:hypothetical protein